MTTPHRVQMSRQHPWRSAHPDAVIVARPSKWGNPISISDVGAAYPSVDLVGIACMVVRDFAVLARRGELSFPNWRSAGGRRGPVTFTYPPLHEIRAELRGRDLACWCPLDEPCHADVLLQLANVTPCQHAGDTIEDRMLCEARSRIICADCGAVIRTEPVTTPEEAL